MSYLSSPCRACLEHVSEDWIATICNYQEEVDRYSTPRINGVLRVTAGCGESSPLGQASSGNLLSTKHGIQNSNHLFFYTDIKSCIHPTLSDTLNIHSDNVRFCLLRCIITCIHQCRPSRTSIDVDMLDHEKNRSNVEYWVYLPRTAAVSAWPKYVACQVSTMSY